MTIPNELLEKWKQYKSHGDHKAIAEMAGVTEGQVHYALKVGRANPELFAIMADFYEDKEDRFSSYLSDYSE
jgi:hypothetical protein